MSTPNENPNQEFLSKLTSKQKAVYMLLQGLQKLEQNNEISVRWDRGHTTDGILTRALSDGGASLPTPMLNEKSRSFEIYNLKGKGGSGDIRLMSELTDRGEEITLLANIGHLKGTESIWQKILSGITSYPIRVRDRYKFSYKR